MLTSAHRLTIPEASRRHFPSLARRLGRIFAHAYFHHREAFEQAEAESSLYARFLALTSKFNLVPSEFLVIPPRLSSMHDGDDMNERLLDVREVEEPRQFLTGLGSQRGGDRWGLSDTGSVIDLALAEDNEPESAPDSAKKRWRSDTMVDRDTYLLGRKKREEGLEKVFAKGSVDGYSLGDETRATSSPSILNIAAPAPAEPHIPVPEELHDPAPTPAYRPPEQHEELLKPPIVVPSQARPVLLPEPADPILEEPPIAEAPAPVDVQASAEEAAPEPAPEPTPEPAEPAPAVPEPEHTTEDVPPAEDITTAASDGADTSADITTAELEGGDIPLVKPESPKSSPEVVQPEPEEVPVEEDVTEAKAEDLEEPVEESEATPLEEQAAAEERSVKVEEKDVEEAVKDVEVAVDDAVEPSQTAGTTTES